MESEQARGMSIHLGRINGLANQSEMRMIDMREYLEEVHQRFNNDNGQQNDQQNINQRRSRVISGSVNMQPQLE